MSDYLPLPEGDAWDDPEDWCPACEGYHPEDVPCSNESGPADDDPSWDQRWALTEAPEMEWYRRLADLAGDDGGSNP